MAIKEIKLKAYFAGIADDMRRGEDGEFRITKHFDIFTDKGRLIPYRDHEADQTIGSTSSTLGSLDVKNFLNGSDGKVYALGVVSDALAAPRIIEKTGGNLPAGDWSLSATATATSGAIKYEMFIEYKDYIYGWKSTNTLWRYGSLASGAKSFDNGWNTVSNTYTNVAQGHIAKDDVLYMPYDHRLASNNNGTFTEESLTLPSDRIITDMDDWGRQLAIATKADATNGVSKVYLWDLFSDDVNDVINFGEGELKVLANIDGALIGVMDVAAASATGLKPTLLIKRWAGGVVQTVKEFPLIDDDGNTYKLEQFKRKRGNKLYFALSSLGSGTKYVGIWVFGKHEGTAPYAFTMDRTVNNTSSDTKVNGFHFNNDYLFVSRGLATTSVERTNNTASYTNESIYETFLSGDPRFDNELLEFNIMTPALTAGQQVVCYYRVNSEDDDDWIAFMTHDEDGKTYKQATQNITTSANFKQFNEVDFKAVSTGGAEVIGMHARWREKKN